MSGSDFSFNLGTIPSTGISPSTGRDSLATRRVSVEFEAATARIQSTTTHTTFASPACDGSSCFIVHNDGPGVTTLSIGEEDGGGGEYLAVRQCAG